MWKSHWTINVPWQKHHWTHCELTKCEEAELFVLCSNVFIFLVYLYVHSHSIHYSHSFCRLVNSVILFMRTNWMKIKNSNRHVMKAKINQSIENITHGKCVWSLDIFYEFVFTQTTVWKKMNVFWKQKAIYFLIQFHSVCIHSQTIVEVL